MLLVFLASILASSVTAEVVPEYYQEAGFHPNRDYINQNFNEVIDPFTGKLQFHYVDIFIPGPGGFDIKVERSYSSPSKLAGPPYKSASGYGWTMHFGRVVSNNSNACAGGMFVSQILNPMLELPDGRREMFYTPLAGASPLYISKNRWKADCGPGGVGLVVTSPDGTVYEMTAAASQQVSATVNDYSWYATKITDRNGNNLTITYTTATAGYKIPQTVTASDGRTVSFTTLNGLDGSPRIRTVSANGATWTYAYQSIAGSTDEFLSQVTRPLGTTWSYQYFGNTGAAGAFALNSVTYPYTGSLSYTYALQTPPGASQVQSFLSTKTAAGGANWTYAYSFGLGVGALDTTTVTLPSSIGTITYQHYGYGQGQTGSPGTVWRIGLLRQKQISGGAASHTEVYDWSNQQISGQNDFRPGPTPIADTGTWAPIMTAKSVTRDGATYGMGFSAFDTFGNPKSISDTGPTASRTKSITYFYEAYGTAKWLIRRIKDESVSFGSEVLPIARTLDVNGNILSENLYGVTTSFTYTNSPTSTAGDVATRTNANGFQSTFGSQQRGIPQTESHPATPKPTVSLSRVVSGAGNVTSETDGEGKTRGYSYDGLNRLTQMTFPLGNAVTVSYTANSRSLSRGGFAETITYDGYGRQTRINRNGISIWMSYDALGRKTFESYPTTSTVSPPNYGRTFTYDALDRSKTVQYGTGSAADGGTRALSYSGNTVTVTNERGYLSTLGYRTFADPDEKTLMSASFASLSAANITMDRDGLGQVKTVSQGGVTRTYTYDPTKKTFLTSEVHPETGTSTYGRDNVGNMTSRSVGLSGTTVYQYDGLNRLYQITYPTGSGAPNVAFDYDRRSKLTVANAGLANRSFLYNDNGNMFQETLLIDGITFQTGYGYDANDNLSSITYPFTGQVVAYSPDALGRPTQASPFLSSVTHHPNGDVNTMAYANGATASQPQYSNRPLPNQIVHSNTGGTLVGLTYAYDQRANITTITDSANGAANRTLAYDPLDRLTGANGAWGTGSISYSGTGDILTQNLGSTLTYGYTNGRLISVSGALTRSYSYDAYGNVTGDGAKTFGYDDASNLRSCTNCGTPNPIAFDYDGKNMRVKRSQGGTSSYALYAANGDLLVEYDQATSTSTYYVYLHGKVVARRTLGVVPWDITNILPAIDYVLDD